MQTKMTSIIMVAFAMLVALTGVVMADLAPGQVLTTYDPNLGSVSNNIDSHLLVQCDGFLGTHYAYSGQSSNGQMNPPIITNQTMFQTGYNENTFAANGLTMYSNNVSTRFPTVSGDVTTLTTDRNILFESRNGVIMSDENVFTAVYGNFPMNGTSEARTEGGSQITNHLAGFDSQFMADNLALSSQNSVISGTVDRASPVIGAYPDLINLDSTIVAQGHSFGFSTLHAFAYDQTGSAVTAGGIVTNIPAADHSYSDTVTLQGNFALNKDFHWALKSVPTIQQFAPVGDMCPLF